MSMSMPGLYRAQVVNTDEFQELGKIKVHILGLSHEDAWEYAEVMTPLGGLPNMGISMVPPIGAVGFVLFERNKDDNPVWIGGVLQTWGDSHDEGWARPVEVADPSDLIIKTQYTKFDDREIDSESNKVENLIKMNENELTIAKVKQSSDYEYKKETYELEDQAYNMLKLTDEDIKLKFKFSGNEKSNTISVSEDKVSLTFDTDQGDIEIKVDAEGASLSVSKTTKITIIDGEVHIDADKIILKGTDGAGTIYEGFRDFVNQAFNSHTHGSPAGPTSPPMKPYTSAQTAKSEHVKLS